MVTQEIRANRSIPVAVNSNSCPSPLGIVNMTVERVQTGDEQQQQQTRDNVLKQLKEVTGVDDVGVLRTALEASRNEAGTYDIAQAANFLVDENAVRYNQVQPKDQQQRVEVRQLPPSQTSTVATSTAGKAQEDVKVIDLTNETSEKEELQKAIALSLQEQHHGMLGGQVTAEEQDISMVLEQSLAESKIGTKRKRGEIWQDPPNPHERKRQGYWPVGLKNVGNTCWFSAVIQSLFQLPIFRRLVLNFVSPPENWDAEIAANYVQNRRNLKFMEELRNLFALMVGSQRKYVDPSKTVEIFKDAFQSGTSDSQQDVSEFTHKLLEWLEDAFKSDYVEPCEKSETAKRSNPMLDLFYGQFRSEGLNDGHVFSKEEKFGQYPLQVNGFGNIHESLEAATAQEIESNNIEAMTKSGQEHWFTQLPPVLLFELSRFQFNQQVGRPEKIHNRFDFPEVIYMDRYMESNKEDVKIKREEIKRLKQKREEWQSQLDKFLNFGSGSKRFPLVDVLKCTLEFAECKPKSSSISAEKSCSPCNNSDIFLGVTKLKEESNSSPLTTSSQRSNVGACPAPGHVSEQELKVLQNCLRRWRTEAENDVKELQENIKKTEHAIKEMYSEASLQKVPYRLHAVLVHEGQAASGHYWAYVYDHSKKRWLKFNDVTVSNTSWEELQKESFGGYHNASAYCLMYIDNNRENLVTNVISEEVWQNAISTSDLKTLVDYDNEHFRKEIAQWDYEQRRLQLLAETAENLAKSKPNESVLTLEPEKQRNAGEQTDSQSLKSVKSIVLENKATRNDTICATPASSSTPLHQSSTPVTKRSDSSLNKSVDQTLQDLIDMELTRCQKLSSIQDPLADARLQHIAIYLFANDVPVDPIITWSILDHFIDSCADDASGNKIRQAAHQTIGKHMTKIPPFHKTWFLQWKDDFKEFKKLAALFITGLEAFHDKRFLAALPYLVNAYSLNDAIVNKGNGKRRGLDNRLLSYYRRLCLLELSNQASQQFENSDLEEAKEAIQTMNDFVVPCMNLLSASQANDDNLVAEEIRSTWCSKLADEEDDKNEFLADFLRKLLDPSSELKLRDNAPLIRTPQDLAGRFSAAMDFSHNNGFLEAALQHR